jgi:hypothetical protein
MTEKKWLACKDPLRMLQHIKAELKSRKGVLLQVACLRHVWTELSDDFRQWAELLASVAEGAESWDSTEEVWDEIEGEIYARDLEEAPPAGHGRWDAILSILAGGWHTLAWQNGHAWQTGNSAWRTERAVHAQFVREIFGNPFRPVKFNKKWRTSDVQLLAKGVYKEMAFDRMPILADALQDAGCDSDDLLSHLRDTTATHVRGCWAIDLVLGKQ